MALAVTFAASALPLGAQARPQLKLDLPADSLLTRTGPLVSTSNMLAGQRLRDLLNAGFPARFHFRVELWSEGRVFHSFQKAGEFDVLARYLAADKVYEVIHVQNDRATPLGKFAAVADAERAIGRPTSAPVRAQPSGRNQYYQATLTVEALSEKDIDEVGRWLEGEIEPGITGRANPASSLSRGIRSVFARLVGGEKTQYETTSPRFKTP